MEVQLSQEKGYSLITLSGRIDTLNAKECESKLQDLIKDLTTPTALSFEDVIYLSSAGLRVVLVIGKTFKAKNIPLYLSNTSEDLKKLFSMTGFDKIFTFLTNHTEISAT